MNLLAHTVAGLRARVVWFAAGLLSVCVGWMLGMSTSWAQSNAGAGEGAQLDPQLHERVLGLPGDPAYPVTLQVTLMLPDGAGPFPLAVLNHGKELGDPRLAPRYRSEYAAKYFVSRGYAVALPMMRGFAGSGGRFEPKGCDAQADGLIQARDIRAVIEALRRLPEIDGERIVIAGQSLGGWNTLALGSLGVPGVRGLINFAGGRSLARCQHLQDDLAQGAAHYAGQTQVASIWFYGDNDKVFPPNIWRAMFEQYRAQGREVELVAYGTFGKDAHSFLAYPEAMSIWMPRLDSFLKRIDLPHAMIQPQVLPTVYPLPTGFAAVNDVAAVPFLNDAGRQGYRVFLEQEMPRVFVLSPDGTAAESHGGYDPLGRALSLCKKNGKTCRPYAIDDAVVWIKPMDMPAATNFAALDAVAAVPYLNEADYQGYRQFLALPKPRAFVIAPDGAWGYSARGFNPLATALQTCQAKHQGCRLYAVDDAVVWAK